VKDIRGNVSVDDPEMLFSENIVPAVEGKKIDAIADGKGARFSFYAHGFS
jgi:hypothetical protein